MAETSARQIVIASLLFVCIIAGGFALISGFLPESSDEFTRYNSTFNKFTELNEETQEVTEKIEEAQPETGIGAILNGLVQSSWSSIKLIWASVGTLTTIIGDIGSSLGLPYWFTAVLITIIMVIIAFAIMSAIFQREL